MNKRKLIKNLKTFVKNETPQYVSLKHPRFNKKLMKAHWLLAKLYFEEGRGDHPRLEAFTEDKAHYHLDEAISEFSNFDVEATRPQYMSNTDEGYEKFREQAKKITDEFDHYEDKLYQIGELIGHGHSKLFSVPKTNKVNLDKELLKIYH